MFFLACQYVYVCACLWTAVHSICFENLHAVSYQLVIGGGRKWHWILVKKNLLLSDADAIKISTKTLYVANFDFKWASYNMASK